MASLASLTTGAALVLPSPQFDALATLQAIHSERATAIYGVPTMFIAALDHPEFNRFDMTSLRTGIMAGAPCPVEVMKRVMNQMHCPGDPDRLRADRIFAAHHHVTARRSN